MFFSQNGEFADFSQINSSHTTSQSTSVNTNSSELLSMFSDKHSMQSSLPIQPNVNNMAGINSTHNQGLMGNMNGANLTNMGMQQGMMGNQPNGMGQSNLIGGPNTMMSQQANMTSQPTMSSQPMMSQQPNMMSQQPNMMSSQPNMMSQQPNMMNAGMVGMQQPVSVVSTSFYK